MSNASPKQILPSKRVLVFAGILVIVGVVYLFSVTNFLGAGTFFSDNTNQVAQRSEGDDGSQESFLANQNPPESGSITDGEVATVTEEDNITERVANSAGPQTLALAAAQENGEDISDQDIARVASSMSANIEVSEPKTFQAENLTQYDSNNNENIQSYSNSLTQILSGQLDQNSTRGPLQIMSNHLQTGSGNLDRLDRFIENNESLIQQLQQITVPPKYVDHHARLLNSLSLAKNSLQKMKQTENDPTVSVIGIQQYRQASNRGLDVSAQIGEQLSNDL